MSRSKGARYERQLEGHYRDKGWWTKRIDASGGGTDNEQPDLLCVKDGFVHVIELKFMKSQNYCYESKEKMDDLRWVAEKFEIPERESKRVNVYLVGRWSRDTTFYGFPPEMCWREDIESYRLHKKEREAAIELPPEL